MNLKSFAKSYSITTINILYSISLLFLLLSITSCGSVEKMKVNYFDGYKNLTQGDTNVIKWDIQNAEYINIEGETNEFKSIDSFYISPKYTTLYKITAVNEIDTLRLISRINVNLKDENVTGNVVTEVKNENVQSFVRSNYWNGIIENNSNITPSRLKIMEIKDFEIGNTKYVKFLLFDAYGNFLKNYNLGELEKNLNINMFCENGNETASILDIDISEELDEDINVYFLVENSYANIFFEEILKEIKKFTNNQKKINVALYLQNQELKEITKLTTGEEFNKIINFNREAASGSNSFYNSTFDLLKKIQKNSLNANNKKEKNIIVTFNYTSDNSSFLHTINDVVDKSNNLNVKIYNINLSNISETYNSKVFSYLKGNTFYYTNDEELDKINTILNEILYSQKYYYEASINNKVFEIDGCDFLKTELNYTTNLGILSDLIFSDYKTSYSLNRFKTLTLFDYKNSQIKEEFNSQLDLLTTTLINNPNNNIELVGHSGIEGDNDFCFEIGQKRANKIKEYLVSKGVNSKQIKLKTEGSNKPIYYLTKFSWQEAFNRRVELRWLDPESLPYEIVTDIIESEYKAEGKVKFWIDKGYKSYFERYLTNNSPNYKVKIWGFKSLKEAEDNLVKLNTIEKSNYVIE